MYVHIYHPITQANTSSVHWSLIASNHKSRCISCVRYLTWLVVICSCLCCFESVLIDIYFVLRVFYIYSRWLHGNEEVWYMLNIVGWFLLNSCLLLKFANCVHTTVYVNICLLYFCSLPQILLRNKSKALFIIFIQ